MLPNDCVCDDVQIWSSSSSNKIPVAQLHVVQEMGAIDRRESAMSYFAKANELAMTALTELMNFTDSNLEVVLFSGMFFFVSVHIVTRRRTDSVGFFHGPKVKGIRSTKSLTALSWDHSPVWTSGTEELAKTSRYHSGPGINLRKVWTENWTFLALGPSSREITIPHSHVDLTQEEPSSNTLSGMYLYAQYIHLQKPGFARLLCLPIDNTTNTHSH